jgi:hypothetical protein
METRRHLACETHGGVAPADGRRPQTDRREAWRDEYRAAGVLFDVGGNALRHRRPFSGFVDVVEPAGEIFLGRAAFRGREFGRFELHRLG